MFKRWGRLHYCFQEMEPFVLEPGKVLLTKLMESDRKTEVVLTKMELSATLEGFSIEVRQFLPLSALPCIDTCCSQSGLSAQQHTCTCLAAAF